MNIIGKISQFNRIPFVLNMSSWACLKCLCLLLHPHLFKASEREFLTWYALRNQNTQNQNKVIDLSFFLNLNYPNVIPLCSFGRIMKGLGLRPRQYVSIFKGSLAYTCAFILAFLSPFNNLNQYPVVLSSIVLITLAGGPGKCLYLWFGNKVWYLYPFLHKSNIFLCCCFYLFSRTNDWSMLARILLRCFGSINGSSQFLHLGSIRYGLLTSFPL